MRRTSQRATNFVVALIVCTSSMFLAPDQAVLAQGNTSITSSGLNTQVSPATPLPSGQITHTIMGGTRPGNGPVLFHSLGEVILGVNHIANFLNDTGLPTTNILSRVTGGSPSYIFGTLQTTGFGGANLFLLNPAGVIFGPTASLNVGGSVTISTANYIKLADGVRFNAVPGASDALLSVASVAAFGFLGTAPGTGLAGTITVQPGTTLAVAPGQTLSLVGRDNVSGGITHAGIEVTGGMLSAPGGQINLVSVDKPSSQQNGGEVVVNPTGPSSGLVPTGFKRLGAIALTQGSSVDTSTGTPGAGAHPAGGVSIRGGAFVMDASAITALSKNLSTGQSGHVEVTANTVTLSNGSSIQTGMTPECCSASSPGNIKVNAEVFSLTDSTLTIATSGGVPRSYTPGAITIQGLEGAGSSARLVNLINSNVSAFGGPDGFVGGSIRIRAKDVSLNQSNLNTSSVDNVGGLISIVAERQIQSEGSGLFSNSFSYSGGTINLQAEKNIDLVNTNVSTHGIFSRGNISVAAPAISISGGKISTEASAIPILGQISSISVNGGSKVTLSDGAVISADNSGGGPGGNIAINSGGTFVSENSTISARSAQGNGGTIRAQAGQKIKLTGSELTTSVIGGPQSIAGGIALESNVVKLQGSRILSTATEGQGGTINITGRHVHSDAASVLDVSSQVGANGTITIQQPGGNP